MNFVASVGTMKQRTELGSEFPMYNIIGHLKMTPRAVHNSTPVTPPSSTLLKYLAISTSKVRNRYHLHLNIFLRTPRFISVA